MIAINKTSYDANKVTCNQTIQHTVADVVDGVIPERVTDIVIEEEEEEEGGKVTNLRALATPAVTSRVVLKYKLTVYDPLLTFEVIAAQLKAKVASGEMDTLFRHYALLFNASSIVNGVFTEPKLTHLNAGSPGQSDPPTDGETAGIVIGSIAFIFFLTVGVWCMVGMLKVPKSRAENEASSTIA